MDLSIEQKQKQPLLDRTEIVFSIDGCETTPSREEVRGKIAAQLNVSEKLVVVKHIRQRFGAKTVSGFCHVYDSEEMLKKVEVKHKIAKNTKTVKSETPKAEA